MAIIYKPFQSRLKTREGLNPYHPRVVYTGTVNLNQLAQEVAAYSSLSTGDVKNTIDNLLTVMTQHLQSSEVVSLDGLGSFRLAFRSKGVGFENEADVDASQSRVVVNFTPASSRNSDRTVATRSLVTGARFVRLDLQDAATSSGSSDDSDSSGGSDDSGSENPLG